MIAMTHGEANGVRSTTLRSVVITSPLVLDQDDPERQPERDRSPSDHLPLQTEGSCHSMIDRPRGCPLLVPEVLTAESLADPVGDRDRSEQGVEVGHEF